MKNISFCTHQRYPSQEMTDRDWRIFREDFDIRIQGGRATLPLRYWKEGNLPSEIIRAIEAVGTK